MALRKCPKCELNYLRPDEKLCAVCSRSVKVLREEEAEENQTPELCSECGENPVVPGHDLCEDCLREQKRQDKLEEVIIHEEDDFEDEVADDQEHEA